MALSIGWRSALVGLALLSATVQAAHAQAPARIPGFFDPKTSTFTALADAPSDASPAAAPQAAGTASKLIQGTITLKAVVTLGASVPANTTFRTSGYASGGVTYAASPSTGASFGNAGGDGDATRGGSTATATLTFPYYMSVEASATNLSVNFALYPSDNTVPSLQFSRVIPIPANGATTVVSFPGAL